MTKPSRSASNGRDALVGSSLRLVDSARMAAKAATGISPIPASAPPAIITSASPRRMMFSASPMAWLLLLQALTVA
jgi:hypothetical protein